MYAEVGAQFGNDTLTDAQVAKAKKLTNWGYRDALNATYPGPNGLPVAYTWSFLTQKQTLSASDGETETDCPEGFIRPSGPIYFDNGQDYSGPVFQVSVGEIMDRRSGTTADEGRPYYFAIDRKAHSATTGTTWQILWDVELDQDYTFVWAPDVAAATLVDDSDVPVGPAWFHQLVMAAGCAQAELRPGDAEGPLTRAYERMKQNAIAADAAGKPPHLGRLDGVIYRAGHGRWTGTVTPTV